MSRIAKWFLVIVLMIPATGYAAREITIAYQGVIASEGELLDNTTGFFKFAICNEDCVTTYWSNDTTSTSGSEPTDFVAVPLVEGVFNLLLGDTTYENMAEIPTSVFQDAGEENLYLRVWFDDGVHGFEQLSPDQRLSIVPYAVRADMTGDLLNVGAISMTGGLNVQADETASGGYAFQITDSARTLFSVDERGTALSHDLVLQSLTSALDLSRFQAGRIFYDGKENRFMGCTNTACSEIGLAGSAGVADIGSVTAGAGLTGGGTSGAVELAVDTNVVVTKSGNHVMSGSLTAASLVAPTVSATALTTVTLTATDLVTANSLSVTTTTTTGGVTMPPTGTGAGNTAELRFKELAAIGPHYVGFKAPDDVTGNRIYTLPAAVPTGAGQLLSSDTNGILSWQSDANAGGDITSVTAGTGLSGGANTGIATLSLDYSSFIDPGPDLGARQAIFTTDGGGGIIFEGNTGGVDSDNELLLTVADPTADRTLTLPNATGTVLINTNCISIAGGEFNPTEDGGTDDYLNLVDNTFSTTEGNEDMFMVPIAMTVRDLYATVDVAPGAGNDAWAVTVRSGGADTALTCTIDETATTCTDTTNATSVGAGAKLAVKVVSSGPQADPTTAAAMTVSFCVGP